MALLRNLSVSCLVVESLTEVTCMIIKSNFLYVNEQTILIPYNHYLTGTSNVKLTFSSQRCEVLEVNIKGTSHLTI